MLFMRWWFLGADVEERDSQGLTALHIALQRGHLNILQHFFGSYPPKEPEHKAIYKLPPSKSLLSLALESCDPEIVWRVLDNGLASTQDIGTAWSWVTSNEGKAAMTEKLGKNLTPADEEKLSDIRTLLMRAGGFTPPPTPIVSADSHKWEQKSDTAAPIQENQPQPRKQKKKKQPPSVDQPRIPLSPELSPPLNANSATDHQTPGRGRGRGHIRGRGKGQNRRSIQ
jgi:hypothetical protein